ncbi:hypothetical protein NE237_031958 [Protea cynaroides]|uniref:Retroviral polymerase SH3-like domain-containing protein n=1 Tax=Protea cynaroides TaxID=273540 RepID=A0A9Q0L347_9MAGN|nr:hypothetical protein NE237_031958 [Protea cynaroides]
MRTFGVQRFPYLRRYTKNKLELRSLSYVFLGYSDKHKGYRCLDPSTGHIFIAQHVVFNENIFPYVTASFVPSGTSSAPILSSLSSDSCTFERWQSPSTNSTSSEFTDPSSSIVPNNTPGMSSTSVLPWFDNTMEDTSSTPISPHPTPPHPPLTSESSSSLPLSHASSILSTPSHASSVSSPSSTSSTSPFADPTLPIPAFPCTVNLRYVDQFPPLIPIQPLPSSNISHTPSSHHMITKDSTSCLIGNPLKRKKLSTRWLMPLSIGNS